MNREFFKIACTRLSLFRPAPKTRALVRALHEATGIPLLQLMAAERRMRALQSFAPLKELLNDAKLHSRERLRYRIGVRERRRGEATPLEQVASQIKLTIRTARGKVDIVARVDVESQLLPKSRKQQCARIILYYSVRWAGRKHVYTQTLALRGESVAGGPVRDRQRRWIGGIVPRTQHA